MWGDRMNKDKRASAARLKVEHDERVYKNSIIECVAKTKIYGPNWKIIENKGGYPEVSVKCCSSTEAAMCLDEPTILNFASYKNPGGGFLNGSIAQEECLCAKSILYNVLSRFPEFYNWNRKHLNGGAYENRALYTPDVVFDEFVANVITCAAPNANKVKSEQILKERIEFILSIARENKCKELVLGAWGCGVFNNDVETVAKCFRDCINDSFEKVIFAVPDKKVDVFREVFCC